MAPAEGLLVSIALYLIDTHIAGKGSVAVAFGLVLLQPRNDMSTPGITGDGGGLCDA